VDTSAQHPSLWQIFLHDVRIYQFFSGTVLFGSLGTGLLLTTAYTLWGIGCLLVAVGTGAMLARRISVFQAILVHAADVPGMITSIRRPTSASSGRYRYRVTYRYTYCDQEYNGVCFISQVVRAMEAVQPGHSVKVLAHRDRPHLSLLPELYKECSNR
jgi:hypothetical protein